MWPTFRHMHFDGMKGNVSCLQLEELGNLEC